MRLGLKSLCVSLHRKKVSQVVLLVMGNLADFSSCFFLCVCVGFFFLVGKSESSFIHVVGGGFKTIVFKMCRCHFYTDNILLYKGVFYTKMHDM